jgi:hypothetical protein
MNTLILAAFLVAIFCVGFMTGEHFQRLAMKRALKNLADELEKRYPNELGSRSTHEA